MAGEKRWEPLLVYKLRGSRFDEHAGIELADLEGLVLLREALVSLATAEWKRRNDRSRLPHGLASSVDLRMRGVSDGCVEVQIYVGRPVRGPGRELSLLPADDAAVTDEDAFIDALYAAVETAARLGAVSTTERPTELPPSALTKLARIGELLGADDTLTIIPNRSPPAEANRASGDAANGVEDEEPPDVIEPGLDEEGEPLEEPVRDGIAYRPDIAARTARAPELSAPASITRGSATVLREIVRAITAAPPAQPVPPANDPVVGPRVFSGRVRMFDADETRSADGVVLERVRLHLDDGDGGGVALYTKAADRDKVKEALGQDRIRLRVRGRSGYAGGELVWIEADEVAVINLPPADAPSEEMFERLAVEDPPRLARMLTSANLSPGLLTFAAEIAGRSVPLTDIEPVLFALLNHEKAIVREGAVLGLAHHSSPSIELAFAWLARDDRSEGVRAVAIAALEVLREKS